MKKITKNPVDLLRNYQRLCNEKEEAEKDKIRIFGLYREYKGKFQESVRKVNETDKNLMEFHAELKKEG